MKSCSLNLSVRAAAYSDLKRPVAVVVKWVADWAWDRKVSGSGLPASPNANRVWMYRARMP